MTLRTNERATRPTDEILRDHLELRRCRDLEGDLERNYHQDVVVISKDGVYQGQDGVRETAKVLQEMLPDAEFRCKMLHVCGEIALLSWSASARNGQSTCDGVDSFLVREGRIAAQTIYYDVKGGTDW